MIIGVDVGATKTLVGAFVEGDQPIQKNKFATSHEYSTFITQLTEQVESVAAGGKIDSINIALPARVDRANGVAVEFGNTDWKNVPLVHDIEARFLGIDVRIENDAKAACLFEASKHPEVSRVMYITVSTGIGIGFCIDGKIAPAVQDAEAGFFQFMSPDTGKPDAWERFASGKALYERVGIEAKDIDDPDIWLDQAKRLAPGLQHIFAVIRPDICLFGGSVGQHFPKYESQLSQVLDDYNWDMVPRPQLQKASDPYDAVLLGTKLMGPASDR